MTVDVAWRRPWVPTWGYLAATPTTGPGRHPDHGSRPDGTESPGDTESPDDTESGMSPGPSLSQVSHPISGRSCPSGPADV